jgi:hypothetical protein
MSWQLWVLIATAVAAMVGLFVLKLRHAQQVFNRIVGQPEEPVADEVARHRLAHEATRRPAFSHHPHVAGHARRHH